MVKVAKPNRVEWKAPPLKPIRTLHAPKQHNSPNKEEIYLLFVILFFFFFFILRFTSSILRRIILIKYVGVLVRSVNNFNRQLRITLSLVGALRSFSSAILKMTAYFPSSSSSSAFTLRDMPTFDRERAIFRLTFLWTRKWRLKEYYPARPRK